MYHRNRSSSIGFLWEFSEILGKCLGTFVWPSEQFWKIFGNLRIVVGNLRKIIKNAVISLFKHYTLARRYELYVLVARTISHSFSLRSLVRYCSCHSNIKFISSRHRVISSISPTTDRFYRLNLSLIEG